VFQKYSSDSATNKAVKETDVKHKTSQKQETESSLAEAKKDLAATHEELSAAMDYYEKLKPSCVDAGVSYEDRVARRKEEIESLQEALKILSGDDIAA
jgi:septal ring factor EnvC (AmiA/AmiB activator)